MSRVRKSHLSVSASHNPRLPAITSYRQVEEIDLKFPLTYETMLVNENGIDVVDSSELHVLASTKSDKEDEAT